MKEVLQRILELQPLWTSTKTPEMDERGQLIRHAGPDWLRTFDSQLADSIGIPLDDLIIEGRDGTGPKTEVPWFRFGSESRSPSATIGWYCVYLFDTEGENAYLTVGRGSTEWNGVEFKPRDHDELRQQATWARGVIAEEGADLADTIALKSRRSPLGPSYEAGTVLAKEYATASIPEPAALRTDALKMASLLGKVYEAEDNDPKAPGPPPEVTAVVEASEEAAGKRKRTTSPGFRPNAAQRKAIELRGMEVAKAALHEWGWPTVTDTSATKPYDFHCKAADEELYVEVKATTADGASVILTRNEVDHVRANHPQTALAIVSNITPPTDDNGEATDGSLSLIYPWAIADSRLSIISYVYETPTEEAERW